MMANVTLSNLRSQSWNNIYTLLSSDLAISSKTSVGGVFNYSETTYNQIVIPPVDVTTDMYSINGGQWDGFITVNIEIYTRKASDNDTIKDLVFAKVLSSQNILSSDGMFLIDSDDSSASNISEGKKPLYVSAITFLFNVDIST